MTAPNLPSAFLKIVLALARHHLKNAIGDETLEVVASTVTDVGGEQVRARLDSVFSSEEGRKELLKAAKAADGYFQKKCTDDRLRELFSMEYGTLPSVQTALSELPGALDDEALREALFRLLRSDSPKTVSNQRINAGVNLYIECLRRALLPVKDFGLRVLYDAQAEIGNNVIDMKADIRSLLEKTEIAQQAVRDMPTAKSGSAPPLPALVIGREDDLRNLKARLLRTDQTSPQILTAIRGWPGVGKTTIASVLAHDPDIASAFPDGILWTSLGPQPNLFSELTTWSRAVGAGSLPTAKTLEEAATQLTAMLRNKRMLLIIDDVWEPEHAVPFRVGGRDCACLITTRENKVAQALAPTPNDIYRLPVLSDEKALELLHALAPSVVENHPAESRDLVSELEGLPLALQVAGHMLNVEASYGFGLTDLIKELREGAAILEAIAPADRTDLANETTPTIAVLLQRSTDRLDEITRACYAYLGAFAPKPATFDLTAMKAVWMVEDPKPIAHTLVDRGLLEPVPTTGRFQMHAVLVMHAKSLLTED
jgi:hypothetical protein